MPQSYAILAALSTCRILSVAARATQELDDGGVPAVEVDRDAGDECGRHRHEKRNQGSELPGLANAAERHLAVTRHPLVIGIERTGTPFRDPAALPLRALDGPDADGVDEDAVRRELLRQRLGERQT